MERAFSDFLAAMQFCHSISIDNTFLTVVYFCEYGNSRSGDSECIKTDHHYKRTIDKNVDHIQGQSVQVLEGPNHRSDSFIRGQAGSPLWATD